MNAPRGPRAPHEQIAALVKTSLPLARRAALVGAVIREARGYRWVGLYRTDAREIMVMGWSGAGAPTYPRFPIEQGLCGAAVRSRSPIVVGDVSADRRYLTTFGSTRSEMVVPILSESSDGVLGLVDVESERLDAFDQEDVDFVSRCGRSAGPLWLEA